MKPKLRKEASIEFHYRMVSSVYNAIEKTQEFPFQNCLTCTNFNEKNEICKLANQRPPARVIVFGCQSYDDIDEIPF